MGKLGEIVNTFIYPLLYLANGLVFLSSFIVIGLGVWLIAENEAAAVGTAMAVFAVGILLMFCSSMGLLGMLRKSWLILAGVVLCLLAMLFALFGIMTICFVLGYRMPSLRDIVVETWHKNCDDPATDTSGCLQAELISYNWCFDHAGQSVPNPSGSGNLFEAGETDPACAKDESNTDTDDPSQRTHVCAMACQTAWIATLENSMGWIAIGCYVAFFTLVLVVMWNSQTHHGLWCLSPSENEDDNENTVMAISSTMAYPAYLLNGILGLAGLALAGTAGAMVTMYSSYTAYFALFLGLFYFIVAGGACFAVAKNEHWALRICNIMYFASCIPLLILSLVAAVYSGEIENVYDTYDDNWCRIRNEIDSVNKDYCMDGNMKMSDAACKAKIVADTATHLRVVGYACLFSLLAVVVLIWFSLRLARKFQFDNPDRVSTGDMEMSDDTDDKGGDDDDDEGGAMDPIQMALLGAPILFTLVALALVFGLAGGTGDEASNVCLAPTGVTADFNGTGVVGQMRFSQQATEDGVALDIEYHGDKDIYNDALLQSIVTSYEIHEFPVPEDGDCSNLGNLFPNPDAGTFTPADVMPATSASGGVVEILVKTVGIEELYYDGENPAPVMDALGPALQLFGERSIAGRSVLLRGPGDCVARPGGAASTTCDAVILTADDDADRNVCEAANCYFIPTTVACGDIVAPETKVAIANLTDFSGFMDGKVRGIVKFSQGVTRGHESDAAIYIELEATDAWDSSTFDAACLLENCADGTPEQNGCDDTPGFETAKYVSCGHGFHVHKHDIPPGMIATARSRVGTQTDILNNVKAVCDAANAHFNLRGEAANNQTCSSASDYASRQSQCETGDLTGMYGKLNIGAFGTPSRYIFHNTFEKKKSLALVSSMNGGTDVISQRSVVLHKSRENPAAPKATPDIDNNRMGCANIVMDALSLSDLGR